MRKGRMAVLQLNFEDWLFYKKQVKWALRLYHQSKPDGTYCMLFAREEIYEGLKYMDKYCRKLTNLFITIHKKKIEEPVRKYVDDKFFKL